MHAQLFAEKVVVITGATSGFGMGIARALGAERASLALAARRNRCMIRVMWYGPCCGSSASRRTGRSSAATAC